MNYEEAFRYEVYSSRWAGLVSWPPLQALAARYFSWKVRGKYGRYRLAMEMKARVEARRLVQSDVQR